MGRRWQVELPFTRPLSLNHRTHYMVRAKATAEVRSAAAELIELAGVPTLTHLTACVVYSPRDSRRRDPINLIPTLKACEDGLVDAGVVPDDNPLYVQSVMPQIIEKNVYGPDLLSGFLWFVIEESDAAA